jgi:hypothetical protein
MQEVFAAYAANITIALNRSFRYDHDMALPELLRTSLTLS